MLTWTGSPEEVAADLNPAETLIVRGAGWGNLIDTIRFPRLAVRSLVNRGVIEYPSPDGSPEIVRLTPLGRAVAAQVS